MRVEERVRAQIGEMTGAERKAARALLSGYPGVGLAPVAEFAAGAGTSAPTVLRFVARLGFANYPEFQRALRGEIQEGRLSPLEKTGAAPDDGEPTGSAFLAGFFGQIQANLEATRRSIPQADFDAACAIIGDVRKPCYLVGGRFTDAVAAYFAAHLRIVRPGIRRFEGQASTWNDRVLDVKPGDIAVIFDIRRYQEDLLRLAARLAERKARIVLFTDPWLSPIAEHARVVLPCGITTGRTWDSSATLMALAEVIVNRITRDNWADARLRMQALERAARPRTEASEAP